MCYYSVAPEGNGSSGLKASEFDSGIDKGNNPIKGENKTT